MTKTAIKINTIFLLYFWLISCSRPVCYTHIFNILNCDAHSCIHTAVRGPWTHVRASKQGCRLITFQSDKIQSVSIIIGKRKVIGNRNTVQDIPVGFSSTSADGVLAMRAVHEDVLPDTGG